MNSRPSGFRSRQASTQPIAARLANSRMELHVIDASDLPEQVSVLRQCSRPGAVLAGPQRAASPQARWRAVDLELPRCRRHQRLVAVGERRNAGQGVRSRRLHDHARRGSAGDRRGLGRGRSFVVRGVRVVPIAWAIPVGDEARLRGHGRRRLRRPPPHPSEGSPCTRGRTAPASTSFASTASARPGSCGRCRLATTWPGDTGQPLRDIQADHVGLCSSGP